MHPELIRNSTTGQFEDKTREVLDTQNKGQQIEITFIGNKSYAYGRDRVRVLHRPKRRELRDSELVEAKGSTWPSATEVLTFTGADGAWSRIFYRTRAGENYRTYLAAEVRVIASATASPVVADVLRYWHAVASGLPRDDPLWLGYEKLFFEVYSGDLFVMRNLCTATACRHEKRPASRKDWVTTLSPPETGRTCIIPPDLTRTR